MKRKTKIFITVTVVSAVLSVIAIFVIVNSMFKAQYNSNGVSHFLVITIDKRQDKEYIGDLEGHKVYIEGLDIEETNFRTMNAEDLSVKEAIEKKLVSIEDWKNSAFIVMKKDGYEILKYENYEIAINSEECIIRPAK